MNKIQHIVLLKFKDGTSEETIASCCAVVARLAEIVEGLETFSGGPYSSPEGLNKGFTHAFVMTFTNAAARDAYLPHPEHEKVRDALLPHLADVVAFDYEIA